MTGVSSRYRVLRRLGQGGMAEVFEAELVGELGFVRKVALKQLRPEAIDDAMAAQRFIDETRIASQLHHAHIVGVLDVGVLDDRPF
ncbi:MAG TPA: protein kinase, partial [Kofleriaceae bacterium]